MIIEKCSFCGREKVEVSHLIGGNDAYICDDCIKECAKLLQQIAVSSSEPAGNKESSIFPSTYSDQANQTFATRPSLPKPKEIHNFLNEYIIGQEHAKKVLSVAVYNHYKRIFTQTDDYQDVELHKSNILLIGPTGSGKTLLAETLAKLLNVPFAIADATTLTEAGYVGEDVENILQKLLQRCNYDISKAETGIVYIDEIDKIARRVSGSSLSRDVSGEGVQQALLKMIEGTVANVPPPGGKKQTNQQYFHVNTTNILFICGGAFADLEKIIRERIDQTSIGFLGEIKNKKDKEIVSETLRQVEPEDLIKYGLIPEFVGRLPIIAILDELTEDALIKVLTMPKNALGRQYQKLFSIEGVELEFTDAFFKAVVSKAIKRKTGARGLRSILEGALLETMYDLPSLNGLSKVVIDEQVITEHSKPCLIFNENKKTLKVENE